MLVAVMTVQNCIRLAVTISSSAFHFSCSPCIELAGDIIIINVALGESVSKSHQLLVIKA